MKKKVNLLEKVFLMLMVVIMMMGINSVCFAATPDFYAMEVDEDEIISGDDEENGGKIYELELKETSSIVLVFFNENGELINHDDLEFEGVVRDEIQEAEFIEDNTPKKGTYKYADNVVFIDGFVDEAEYGEITYNNPSYSNLSVKFTLKKELIYKKVIYGDDGIEEANKNFYKMQGNEDEQSHYARFYFNNKLLDVENIFFEDDNGNLIDDSIIKAESGDISDAWCITYTQNVQGTVIIETADTTYEMPLDIDCFEVYFGDDEEEEISRFIYVSRKCVNFYLYNAYGTIEEVEGGENISFKNDDGRIEFTVDNFTENFTYRISVNGEIYRLRIYSEEYAFHAKEVTINSDDTYTIKDEKLDSINLFENEVKYFVFYDEGEIITFEEEITDINMDISENSAFADTELEDCVYEIFFDNTSKKRVSLEYNDSTIKVVKKEDVSFYTYEDGEFDEISEFKYKEGEAKTFYLYVEERELKANELTINNGAEYVTINDDTLTIGENDEQEVLNVIKITVKDTLPNEFSLEIYISKWNVESEITVTNADVKKIPLQGFYTSYTEMTEDTFIGDIEDFEDYEEDGWEYTYIPGDVIYYVLEESDSYIFKESEIDTSIPDIEIELINTGREIKIDGEAEDRYAIKITISEDAEGELNGKIVAEYENIDGECEEKRIYLTLEDVYDSAPTGEISMEYNEKEYLIGFTVGWSGGATGGISNIGNEYNYSYYEHNEGLENDGVTSIVIYEVVKTSIDGGEIEDYREAAELYENIKSVEAYVANFNPKTLEFERIDNQATNCVSITNPGRLVTNENTGESRWVVDFMHHNLTGKCFIVADVTFDNDEVITVAMKYNSYIHNTIRMDLNEKNKDWGIIEINEYITKMSQKSKVTEIQIVLNPDVVYGSGDDSKVIVLQGEKPIYIDGNGATVIGRIETIAPKAVAKMPCHGLNEIHFVSDKASIEDNTNICIDGTGDLQASFCNFKNYHIAINVYSKRKQGVKDVMRKCIFENNKYAIYIDGKGRESISDLDPYSIGSCKFINNHTGIYIVEQEELNSVHHLLKIERCEFISNDKNAYDIINKSEFKYISYGCVFAKPSSNPDLVIEARAPKTQNIKISYVYREPILILEDSGFLAIRENIPVAYAPYTENGSLDNFTYNNTHNVGVDVKGFNGEIDVVGDYNMNKNDYNICGTWKFAK